MLLKTTLAEAPIKVPLPPRHAPKEMAHHNGATSTPVASIAPIRGISVATKGILSSIDEEKCNGCAQAETTQIGRASCRERV